LDKVLNGEYSLSRVVEVMLEEWRWVMRRSRHAPIGSDKGEGDVLGEVQLVKERKVRNVIVERMGIRNRLLCGRMCLCIFYVYLFFK
jgi:hypothetical protein